MTHKIKTYNYLKQFQCLGADCEDTCCRIWDMQVDAPTVKLYEKEAPELMDAVQEKDGGFIMKRNPETDFCVKFDDGLCSTHNEKGDKFLSDACHFYPRITRKFGDETIMSAALSCPEIARLSLLDNRTTPHASSAVFNLDSATPPQGWSDMRLPSEVKDYLPEGMESEKALSVTEALINMTNDESASPEKSIAKLVSISGSLARIETMKWSDAINLFIKIVDGRLPTPESHEDDLYNIVYTLVALIHAFKKPVNPRLNEVISTMEKGLGININRETLVINSNPVTKSNYKKVKKLYEAPLSENHAKILRKWLQTQLAMSSFPFGGLGDTPEEKAIIIAVRFASVKLGIIAHKITHANDMSENEIIKIVQSIARFTDHLASPELSLNMYEELGWTREPRLMALVGIG